MNGVLETMLQDLECPAPVFDEEGQLVPGKSCGSTLSLIGLCRATCDVCDQRWRIRMGTQAATPRDLRYHVVIVLEPAP